MLPKVTHDVAGYFAVAFGIGALFTIYAWTVIRSGRASVPKQSETAIAPPRDV
jgi:hypothetical protein